MVKFPKTETYKISDLAEEVKKGNFRIPEFQRSFRWGARDVLALFDSVMKGYPFGNLLLWQHYAPQDSVRIGALDVLAPEKDAARWVIDGQQRLTSLVNAIDPDASQRDSRFALSYDLRKGVMRLDKDLSAVDLAIPVSVLVNFGRTLQWLQEHPESQNYIQDVQEATNLLNSVEIPATIIVDSDESVLREIFDRINSRGKALKASEIFDAIHSTNQLQGENGLSLAAIRNRLNAKTGFGLNETEVVLQALLVRRHPDVSRDVHDEFSVSRSAQSDFPRESQAEAFAATEVALLKAIEFLQTDVGVPHNAFLPFRFQLLVLVRFFAVYPDPHIKNRALLSRWFWRASVSARGLKLSGRVSDVRMLARSISRDSEDESVQRLLDSVASEYQFDTASLDSFQPNQAFSKMICLALWALEPENVETHAPISVTEIGDFLGDGGRLSEVVVSLVKGQSRFAANRFISLVDSATMMEHLILSATTSFDLKSHLLTTDMVDALKVEDSDLFLNLRRRALEEYLDEFLRLKIGLGFESTKPLQAFTFDDD